MLVFFVFVEFRYSEFLKKRYISNIIRFYLHMLNPEIVVLTV